MPRPRPLSGIDGSGGFTVIELVVVLVLLGILTAVGAPRFFSMRGFQGDFFFDDLLGALRYGQRLAVASGCPVEFRLSGSSFALTQRQLCTSGPFDQVVAHPGTGAPGYTGTAPAGLVVTTTQNPLIFDALGRTLDASFVPSDVTLQIGTRQIALSAEIGFAHDPSS